MEKNAYNIAIIGAGLSGLAAAIRAEESGHKTIVIESSNKPGGRVKTDEIDGFLLDHGFQVLLSGYSKANEMFDIQALNLGYFGSGALITDDSGSFKVGDPLRDAGMLLPMIFSRVGSISDKFKMFKLTRELKSATESDVFSASGTTLDFLRRYGFSETIISRFFKPFFGGIFLERELQTPAAMFSFVFKTFSSGYAALPENGMQELSNQLAGRLKETSIRFNSRVESLNQDGVITLSDGTTINAKKIIVACDPRRLVPQIDQKLNYQHTTTVFFKGSDSLKEMKGLIGLDAKEKSTINNYARHDEVQPSVAPKGFSLWSVTTRRFREKEANVKRDLANLIGCAPDQLVHIKSYHIEKALPQIQSPVLDLPPEQTQLTSNIYLAGDYLVNASIDGALRSGCSAAEAVTETLDIV
ncbi:MAG TPA: NAD(P)/FAD-dependent oxidoreductase [Cryomorphaceae bacterium]|nr:NAD(P)/FAD-dependent oxidoreductase [Cryomorphaceae bacterium]